VSETTVLYVDPEPRSRDRVERELAGRPAIDRVLIAGDGEGALDRLIGGDVRAVVTEYDLPERNGVELHREIADRWPTVPVLLYTAHGSETVAGDAIAAGVAGYVPKRAGTDLLVDRLADVLSLGAVDRHGSEPGSTGDRSGERAADEAGAAHSELIVDQAPLGIVEWNLDMTVAGWNPAAEELFGYSTEEAVGRHATDLLVPEDNEWAITTGWRRLVESGVGSHRVNENVRADGSRIRCEWYNAPLLEDGETVGVISFVRDVTAERRRRRQLDVLNRVLRHDLRNRLTVIRGAAESVLAEDDYHEAARFAQLIIEECDELDEVASETSEIDSVASADEPSRTVVDAVEVVEDAVGQLDPSEFDLTVRAPETAPVRVHEVFPRAIEHVVENAAVHNDRPRKEVAVTVERGNDTVAIDVADNGPGIPETERRLVTGDAEVSQLRHGGGLGLWVTRWAVTRSGGRLTIDDNEPRGTVVTIEVPAAVNDGTDGD